MPKPHYTKKQVAHLLRKLLHKGYSFTELRKLTGISRPATFSDWYHERREINNTSQFVFYWLENEVLNEFEYKQTRG